MSDVKYNWKVIETKSGKISFALCIGEKLHDEIIDINVAYQYEKEAIKHGKYTFSNSIDDFLSCAKLEAESKMRGEYYKRKFERTNSSDFRSLQKKLEKAEKKSSI